MATAEDDRIMQRLVAAGASFRLRREDAGGLPVLVLEGELDLATAPRLGAVMQWFGPGERVTVDLSRLDFMDCSGVRELMRASAVLGDGLRVVCGRQGPVRRLFDAVAMEQLLSVYPSRAEALRAARTPDARSRRAGHTPLRRGSAVRAARAGHRHVA